MPATLRNPAGHWTRSGTDLTPSVAGDNIEIAGTGRIDGGLFDNAGTPLLSVDLVNRKLYDSYGDASVDWENWQLQFGGAPVFDWSTSQVFDSASQLALDFSSRMFYAGGGTDVILDFNTVGLADFKDSNITTTGRIASGHRTHSAAGPTNNVDAAGINTLFIDTSSNNVTIGGFVGGVAGQELRVVVVDATNDTTLENIEGTGNQDIYLHAGADETLDGHYGGWNLVCNGTHWYDESHSKHV